MTYCLGILVRQGFILAADSRTNAGVDYVSSYQKLFDFSCPGERVLILCTSGNLSITQAITYQLEQEIRSGTPHNLHTIPSLYDAARYIGKKTRQLQQEDRPWLEKDGIDFQCNFLLAGQIAGAPPELFLIYSQGNCIRATPETPYLQIGETKYGKPILDRTLSYESSLDAIAKSALLSIDSTMRSNLSVGPPIDMISYTVNSLKIQHRLRLEARDPYLLKIRRYWESALKQASEAMPAVEWNRDLNQNGQEPEGNGTDFL
ncbi:peptidase [Picosynechococcus sp. PCC 7003]|uniref:proteasome-type protease n=1 Tax=Picosynechococcus sp. PCC 7003 TaxID=374981 RepID=UPI0008109330|nr:proteasome-type protease [Picosynechococcus sp. PCC 7003]ANV83336.1 peptidase [Picosynechococcus sp. PCC 7003]